MATSDPIISPLADPVTFSDILITSGVPSTEDVFLFEDGDTIQWEDDDIAELEDVN